MISKVNKNYCSEPLCNIENYKLAVESNETWVIHHRLETHDSEGIRRLVDISATEMIMLGMYYNRPASELIFLEKSEHLRLHKIGKKFSDGLRLRLSKLHIGKHISEEQKQKIGDGNRGKKMSEEAKQKIGKANRGRKFGQDYCNSLKERFKVAKPPFILALLNFLW